MIAASLLDRPSTVPDPESQGPDVGEGSYMRACMGAGTKAVAGAEATIMRVCRLCIGPCFPQRQACIVCVSV